MGLDMYAYTAPSDLIGASTDIDLEVLRGVERLHYWRKHPNLHGWMEALYRIKGGQAEVFNCVSVRLTTEDLDALEQAVQQDRLPETTGFFFGVTRPEEKEEDLAFIAKARQALKEGKAVLYDSWW
jgi:hypothetical protein